MAMQNRSLQAGPNGHRSALDDAPVTSQPQDTAKRRPSRARASLDSPDDADPWLTVRGVARHLKCSEHTVYRSVRQGLMRAAFIGGRREIRIRQSWADASMEATSTPIEATR
jgi:excisionase family DNA binding protein